MSSNASEEYISDTMETLSLPYGFVHHFRYQLKWIDNNLKSKLRRKEEEQSSVFENMQVIIFYLYQTFNDNNKKKWKWEKIYPLRTGILMDAYKTGDLEDIDVAHFYFMLEDYFHYNDQDFTTKIKINAQTNFGKDYAFLNNPIFTEYIADETDSKSAFHKIQLC